jgi:hypothetical protein
LFLLAKKEPTEHTEDTEKVENPKSEIRNPKQIQNIKAQNSKQKQATALGGSFCFGHLDFGHLILFRISCFEFRAFFLSV